VNDLYIIIDLKAFPVNIFIGIKGIAMTRQVIQSADNVLWRNGIVPAFIISSWWPCHVRRTYLSQGRSHLQTVSVVRSLQVRPTVSPMLSQSRIAHFLAKTRTSVGVSFLPRDVLVINLACEAFQKIRGRTLRKRR
jgi:hypothetical protein